MKARKLLWTILAALSVTHFLGIASQPAMAKNGTTPVALRGTWHSTTSKSRYVMKITKHSMSGYRYSKKLHRTVNHSTVTGSHLYSHYIGKGYYEIGIAESDAVSDFKPMHYHGKKVLYEHLGYFNYGHRHQIWYRGK